MRRAAALVFLGVAVFATAAAANTPLPSKPQGSGMEPTRGGGVMGGAPIRPRYAIIEYGTPGGDLSLYLSPRPIRCGIVSYNQAPYVWVIVHTEGTPPRVGKPSLSNGHDIVQVNFTFKDHYVSATPGVTLLFTRIDPYKNSTWRGRLTVRKLIQQGRAYSYHGTFAARWCGNA